MMKRKSLFKNLGLFPLLFVLIVACSEQSGEPIAPGQSGGGNQDFDGWTGVGGGPGSGPGSGTPGNNDDSDPGSGVGSGSGTGSGVIPPGAICAHPDAANYDEDCEDGEGTCYFYVCRDDKYQEYDPDLIASYLEYISDQKGGEIFHDPSKCENLVTSGPGEGDGGKIIATKGIMSLEQDGRGGFFAGGVFKLKNEEKYRHLIFVDENNKMNKDVITLTGGECLGQFGVIHDMLLVGETLYIAGEFSHINGEPRQNIAAIHSRTHKLLPFNIPNKSKTIRALAIHQNVLYLGGQFEEVAGEERLHLAGYDLSKSKLTPLSIPLVDQTRSTSSIHALAVDAIKGQLHVGGAFDLVIPEVTLAQSIVRFGLLTVDLKGGNIVQHVNYPILLNDLPHTPWQGGYVASLDFRDNKLFIGGNFSQIAKKKVRNLAAVDTSDWSVIEKVDVDMKRADKVFAVLLNNSGSGLYFSGIFSELNSTSQDGVTLFSTGDGVLKRESISVPQRNGVKLSSVLLIGNKVIIGASRGWLAGPILYSADSDLKNIVPY